MFVIILKEVFMLNLRDDWKQEGCELGKFKQIQYELERNTIYKKGSTAEVALLLPGYSSKRNYFMQVIDPDSIDLLRDSNFDTDVLNEVKVPIDAIDPDLLAESESVGFMLQDQSEDTLQDGLYHVAKNALPSLFLRAEANGKSMYRNSLPRDVFLEESLFACGIGADRLSQPFAKDNPMDHNCTFVLRKNKRSKKLFFVPTEKYGVMTHGEFAEAADYLYRRTDFGLPQVRSWKVTHFLSEITFEFPDMCEEDVTPGIILRNSDIGSSCFEVRLVCFMGDSSLPFVLKAVGKKHCGNVDPCDVIDEALSSLYSAVGEMQKYVKLLKSKKLSKKSNNYKKLTDVIGKGREVAFRKNCTGAETRYDVVLKMSLIPRDYGLSDSLVEDLSGAIYNIMIDIATSA